MPAAVDTWRCVKVFAVDEEQDGLVLLGEMGQGALEIDDADNAGVTLAGAAFAPSLAVVVGDVAALESGAIGGPLPKPANG